VFRGGDAGHTRFEFVVRLRLEGVEEWPWVEPGGTNYSPGKQHRTAQTRAADKTCPEGSEGREKKATEGAEERAGGGWADDPPWLVTGLANKVSLAHEQQTKTCA
jgi:hypothetical protein